MAEKIDLQRSLDAYGAKPGELRIVDVPELQYLMLDGKRELGRDDAVMPLEGLWWADDMDAFTMAHDRTSWQWTLLMLVPDWTGGAMVDEAVAAVGAERAPARLHDIRVEPLAEGRCLQTLHIGAFDDEGPVLERMHRDVIPEQACARRAASTRST